MLLLSISMSLLENYLTLSFPAIFVKEKYPWLKWVFMGILTLTSFYLDTLNYPFLMIVPVIVLVLYCIVDFKDNLCISIFYMFFMFTILYLIDVLVLCVENSLIDDISIYLHESKLAYPICLIINKIILVVIYLFFKKHKNIFSNFIIKDSQMFMFSITEVVMYLLITLFLAFVMQDDIDFFVFLCLIVLLTIMFFLFSYQYILLIKANKKVFEEEMKRATLEFNKSYYEDFQKAYDMNKALSHDMKNHFTLIYTMLQENQVESAMEYIKGVYHKIGVFKAVKTEREILNYIIDSKLFNTKDLNIKYVIDINDNLDFIDNIDLCILLGNLLDNCIEAVEKIDNRFIELIIDRKEDIVFISLRNTFDQNSLKCMDGELMTSKEDAGNHGIGIKNVKDIINKYNGDMLIDIDDYFNIYIYFLIM